MRTDRLVLDTNVFISGFISTTSVPGRVVDHAVAFGQLVATHQTLEELITRLMAAMFDQFLSRSLRQTVLDRLVPLVEIVEAISLVRACRDPKDNMFLEAAVNGRADVLVSGTKDLLVLNPFAGIAILSPAEYLVRIAKSE